MNRVDQILKEVYFHYQPVVNIKTGEIFGYEALIRGFKNLGFKNPLQLFDYAYKEGFLFELDMKLREMVIYEFLENFKMGQRLFFNLDSRVIYSKNYKKGETLKILENLKISPRLLVFEVSERFKINEEFIEKVLKNYKEQGFEIALDDFGIGHVCLEAVYKLSPNYLKIDRFFIENLNKDLVKKEIVNTLNKLCEKMNTKIIAEGLENEGDVYTLEETGVVLLQGYFIKEPSSLSNSEKLEIKVEFKRYKSDYDINIKNYLKKAITVNIDDSTFSLLDILKDNEKDLENLVVLDKKGHPLAFISFKKLALMLNNNLYTNLFFLRKDKKIYDLKEIFEPINIIEATRNLDVKLIEHLLENSHKEYFVVTENFKFIGVIHYKDLIKITLREKLLESLDKNPLTKLPGNSSIEKYLSDSIENQKDFFIAYFDFNNFKPFNDYYGFRRGDRAILMFSEILKSNFISDKFFVGHIGGDDFFIGAQNIDFLDFYKKVLNVIKSFNHNVVSLYDKEDIEKGFIVSKDRDGNTKQFGFLTVSAAIIQIKGGNFSFNDFNILEHYIAIAKKNAKQKDSYIESLCILKNKVEERVWI